MTDPRVERLLSEPPVRAAREALAGTADESWVVGGTVRDALLDRPLRDLDLAVAGDPRAAARAVGRALGGPVFQLSEAFGTWRAIDRTRRLACDVSRLQGPTIGADLAQRDFTVNAIAVPLFGGALLDPTGGIDDLEAGVLRVVGPDAYAADPLRPLRLARLATELPLAPDADTERLTRAAAPRVPEASPERIFGELRRLVAADEVLAGMRLAGGLGLIAAVLPELEGLRAVEQSHFHHLDVHDHTLEVLGRLVDLEREGMEDVFGPLAPELREVLAAPLADELTRSEALRFGALLHDIGKPATRSVRDDGRVTFVGHDAVGEEMTRAVCRRLRTSERLAGFLAGLARHHLALGFLVHHRPLDRRTVYRYLSRCSPVEVEVTVLSCADRLATRGRNAGPAIAAHLELARELMQDALSWRALGPPSPPIRGDELAAELGLEPGPQIGRLLAELREARFAGEAGDRDEALALARRSLGAARE